jgi:hypothetical protein
MRWMCGVLVAAGCSGALPAPGLVARGALVAAVAPDESMVATVSSKLAWRLIDIRDTGDGVLEIHRLTPGPEPLAAPLDGDVKWVAGWTRSGYLLYAVDRDHTLPKWAGVPMAWTPGLNHPIRLSDDLAEFIYGWFDDLVYLRSPSRALSVVRLADCGTATCSPIALGQSDGGVSFSRDGSKCAYQSVVGDAIDFHYFDIARGGPQQVGHLDKIDSKEAPWPLIGISSDGSRLAMLGSDGGLRVVETTRFFDVPWAPLPSGKSVLRIEFDGPTRIVLVLASAQEGFVYDSSETQMRQLASGSWYYWIDADGEPERRLVALSFASGSLTVSAVDLAAGASVSLGTFNWPASVPWLPTSSQDGKFAAFLTDYSTAANEGALKVADLRTLFAPEGPTITTVGTSNFHGYGFAPGADELLFFEQWSLESWTPASRRTLQPKAAGFRVTASRRLLTDVIVDESAVGTLGTDVYVSSL